MMHEEAVARDVPLAAIPAGYLDTDITGLKPHDSRWKNEKLVDTLNWLGGVPKRPREIIYYP